MEILLRIIKLCVILVRLHNEETGNSFPATFIYGSHIARVSLTPEVVVVLKTMPRSVSTFENKNRGGDKRSVKIYHWEKAFYFIALRENADFLKYSRPRCIVFVYRRIPDACTVPRLTLRCIWLIVVIQQIKWLWSSFIHPCLITYKA